MEETSERASSPPGMETGCDANTNKKQRLRFWDIKQQTLKLLGPRMMMGNFGRHCAVLAQRLI